MKVIAIIMFAIISLYGLIAILLLIDRKLLRGAITSMLETIFGRDEKENMKYIECSICGEKFTITKEDLKIVKESVGLATTFRSVHKYESVDCPECGCQKILQLRLDK